MIFLDDMKDYIDSLGVDIPVYVANMPSEPTTCIALFEYAGMPPEQGYTHTPGLQLLIRTAPKKYSATYDALYNISEALLSIGHEDGDNAAGMEINGTRYLRVYTPASGVNPLGKDDNGNPLFSKNYYVVMEEKHE